MIMQKIKCRKRRAPPAPTHAAFLALGDPSTSRLLPEKLGGRSPSAWHLNLLEGPTGLHGKYALVWLPLRDLRVRAVLVQKNLATAFGTVATTRRSNGAETNASREAAEHASWNVVEDLLGFQMAATGACDGM